MLCDCSDLDLNRENNSKLQILSCLAAITDWSGCLHM